jgi:hypothetical protein
MVSMYRRPIGWRGESHRHYLAAKGISSRFNRFSYFAGKGNLEPGPVKAAYADRWTKEDIINRPDVRAKYGITDEMLIDPKSRRMYPGMVKTAADEQASTVFPAAESAPVRLAQAQDFGSGAVLPSEITVEPAPIVRWAPPKVEARVIPSFDHDLDEHSGAPKAVNTNFDLGVQ